MCYAHRRTRCRVGGNQSLELRTDVKVRIDVREANKSSIFSPPLLEVSFHGSLFSAASPTNKTATSPSRMCASTEWQVRNRVDRRLYAVKKVGLDPFDKETNRKIRREVTTISTLIHKNIVR